MDPETFSFGYWLRRQRKALDLTQAALGKHLGYSKAMIRKIEQDERRPSRDLAHRMVDLFQLCEPQRTLFLRAARHELGDVLDIQGSLSYALEPLPLTDQALAQEQGTALFELREHVKKQHANWYMHYSSQAEPYLRSDKRLQWICALDADMPHLRAALHWAINEHNDVLLGLHILGSLWQFWHVRGYYREAKQWLEHGLEQLPRVYDRSVVARAYMTLGNLAWFQRDHAMAQWQLEQSLKHSSHTDNPALRSETLSLLAISVLDAMNDQAHAQRLSYEALSVAEHAEPWDRGMALFWHSVIAYRLNQPRNAYKSAMASWHSFQQVGDLWNMGPLSIIADIAYDRGEYACAYSHYRQVAHAFQLINDHWGVAFSLRRLAEIQYCRHEYQQAHQLARQSFQHWQQLGDSWAAARVTQLASTYGLTL